MSEGNKGQKHLPDNPFAVFEAITDPVPPFDLRVHALDVAVRRPPGVIGKDFVLPALKRSAPRHERRVTGFLCLKADPVQNRLGFLSWPALSPDAR
ncbi:hypothetical protein SA87_12235 [Hydrogenibacillus schlegelii]|uniref:Uncharacterized protein n=1 Tax=Hydrogenibacillus schlegelii TaxID=1484 RepID=A0A179IQ44_HYDSH|nr:hypothetical protein SA87_12235 [Hydrogenibacillus schlegelii]